MMEVLGMAKSDGVILGDPEGVMRLMGVILGMMGGCWGC